MNDTVTPAKLVIRRTIDAPQARVYEAWTRPDDFRSWFGPEGYTIPNAHLDVREGGTYRIEFRAPDGERNVVGGTFREVRPPERLAFTWSWEEDDAALRHESLVTIDFHPAGNRTDLVLTHENLVDAMSRDRHSDGWTQCLAKLEVFAAKHEE